MSKFIELNGETYKRIDDLDEEKPSLKPEEGEEFYYMDEDGHIGRVSKYHHNSDKEKYEIGNYYREIEDIEQKVKELKAIQRVKEYIVENFGYHPEKWADWSDGSQGKYTIFWDGLFNKGLVMCQDKLNKPYSPNGYLKTEEQAEQLIKDKKEDLETIYKPK